MWSLYLYYLLALLELCDEAIHLVFQLYDEFSFIGVSIVDLPDEVVGQLPVPGCLLADAGEGVVQVVLQLSIAFGNAGGCFVDTGQVTHTT